MFIFTFIYIYFSIYALRLLNTYLSFFFVQVFFNTLIPHLFKPFLQQNSFLIFLISLQLNNLIFRNIDDSSFICFS